MTRFLHITSIMLLASCSARLPLNQMHLEATENRKVLLRYESNVSADFFETRTLHQELMQLTARPDAYPYPALDSLFNAMHSKANIIIESRMDYDVYFFFLDSLHKSGKKIKERSALADTLQLKKKVADPNLAKLPLLVESFENLDRLYWQTCKAESIYRIPISDYAAELNDRVASWLDSLMTIGDLISSERADLKKKFPEQKGEQFFSHYKHLSELEAKLKSFDGSIMQLQNSLSRMEGANQLDAFVFGPYIDKRREVVATESIIGDLMVKMAACRELSDMYWNSYK